VAGRTIEQRHRNQAADRRKCDAGRIGKRAGNAATQDAEAAERHAGEGRDQDRCPADAAVQQRAAGEIADDIGGDRRRRQQASGLRRHP
jgi:hypothetical protein